MDVVVHGGAGRIPDDPDQRAKTVEAAAKRGTSTESPVVAVREAISHLERDPRFNAGIGSAVQSDGRIRTDAGIMTDTGDIGAACAMEGVRDAIAVADAVRTETPHVLLAGEHAVDFADAMGIETDVELSTRRTRERWADADLGGRSVMEQCEAVRARFGAGHDTVGAVATDGTRIVAGTSTGGRWYALAGRVGDVPQVGCGYFASPSGGVSTTGAGEDIARVMLAREAAERLARGEPPEAAATGAIEDFERASDRNAGLIVLSPSGDVGSAYTSEAMQWSHAKDGEILRPAQSQYL